MISLNAHAQRQRKKKTLASGHSFPTTSVHRNNQNNDADGEAEPQTWQPAQKLNKSCPVTAA